MNNTAVSLKINQRKLVESLRLAFADQCSFIQELAQNGRRAGASEIRIQIDKDKNTITVSDNGSGIADMAQLLAIAVSGWDDETIQQEHPYGMGFLSVLYQAKKITVSSRGKQLCANTADILDFQAIRIKDITDDNFTHIRLEGLKSIPESVESIFMGFPISVIINSEAVDRPHALDNSDFVTIGGGLLKTPSGEEAMGYGYEQGYYYYQGFCIQSPASQIHRRHWNNLVIHVDEKRYEAVLPDRRCLIDHRASISQIYASAEPIRIAAIKQYLLSLSEEGCCRLYREIARLNLLRIFNQVNLLPAAALREISEYPIAYSNHEGKSYDDRVSKNLSRSDIENGSINLVDADLAYEADEGFNLEMYLYYLENTYLIDRSMLDEEHWAHPFIKSLDAENLSIEIAGRRVPTILPKSYFLCDKYFIHGILGTVEVSSDGALLRIDSEASTPCTVVIPNQESSGQPVLQTDSFQCEYDYDATYEDNEWERLSLLICQERLANDLPALFKSYIKSKLPAALIGHKFEVSIDKKGIANVLDS